MDSTPAHISHPTTARQRVIRFVLAFSGLIACLYGLWFAARDGITLLLSEYAMVANLPVAASEAVRLNPAEPEAHYALAAVLSARNELPQAVREFERAASLRPLDYALWQQLASARDQANDEEGAIMAAREAVRLAPYYAQPRWRLGNLLFRVGRRDEAFMELRRAIESDPSLLLNLIDLAWGATNGDARAVVELINPQTATERLELARFFVKRGQTHEALALFRAAGDVSENDRRALLNELLAAKNFTEAHEVWSSRHPASGQAAPASNIGVCNDGGFEGEITLDDPGFSWQLARDLPAVRFAQDPNEPRTGTYSLRLDYSGDSAPSARAVAQLIIVEPGARYRLSFAARVRELVSGGLPVVIISDAGSNAVLGQSPVLPRGSSGWRDYAVDFVTAATTTAVVVSLQRQSCSSAPCPIFGSVWLDDFSLQKR